MKSFDAQHTGALLPYAALVDALQVAALELARGEIRSPQRQVTALAGGTLLSMLAVGTELAAHKLVTFVPGNPQRQLPAIQGQMSVWDARSGVHMATLDGATVTGRRTAALSMLGVRELLALRPRSFRIIGTGAQALYHIAAIAELYPEAKTYVSGRSEAAAAQFCAAHAGPGAQPWDARTSAEEPVDVVITCTSSQDPVYESPAQRGCLLIAIGAFTPAAAEIAAETVRASRIYVDDLDAARQEAGDLIRAGVEWRQVQPLANVLQGAAAPDGPVFFKTVGCAAWDLAAARVAAATLRAGAREP